MENINKTDKKHLEYRNTSEKEIVGAVNRMKKDQKR